MELVALIGEDREGWGQVTGLIRNNSWSKIVLIKNSKVKDFPPQEGADIVNLDSQSPITEMKDNLLKSMKGRFSEFEVHLSLASGNGKEHMALISALLSIPVGIRLVAFTKKGIEVIN